MGCNLPEYTVSAWDIVKVVVVDVVMVLSLAGNVGLYIHARNQHTKSSPAEVLLRFICKFGIIFAVFSGIGFTLSTFCGEIYERYAMCAVYGFLFHVSSSGWIWVLSIATVERYTKCVKTAEYCTWFSTINVRIMLWGAILLLSVVFFAPVYGWGQYSPWRGQLNMQLWYNSSAGADQQETASGIGAWLSNATNAGSVGSEGKRLTERWMKDYKVQISAFHLHHLGLFIMAHARHRDGVGCLWRSYEAGELAEEAGRELGGLFPGLQNLTYSILLNKDEVMQYQNIHLYNQASSSCGLDFTQTRRDSYAFTVFLLLAMLATPLTVIIFTNCKILWHSRKQTKATHREKITEGDYMMSKVYFAAALMTLLLYMPYFLLDIFAGAGYYLSESVHFVRHITFYSSSCTLCVSYVMTKKCPTIYTWVQFKLGHSNSIQSARGTPFGQDLQETRIISPSSTINKIDMEENMEAELMLRALGPSTSSTETQITTI